MDGMSGGMMGMGPGVPSLFHQQKIFWAFVGSAIGAAAVANVINKILCYHRLAVSSENRKAAARPSSVFFQSQATLAATVREYSYYSPPISIWGRSFYLPPVGLITMMVAYLILIVVCGFYRLHPNQLLQLEPVAYRFGFLAVAQLPLIVLLAGKRNIIGFLTGVGYERLSWLHRWVARSLLFTILIHMGFFLNEWARYDYIMVKFRTDHITKQGLAAFGVLCWLVVSSLAPIRHLSYEFFVIQHVGSWIGFLVAVYRHVPSENWVWIWVPLGIWAFDRVVRFLLLCYTNLALFHKSSSGILSCEATFERLDATHTRITIDNPPISWSAGQHVLLSCYPLAPFTSHPFTISSLPGDGRMEFIVNAKNGTTRKFYKYAEKAYRSLPLSLRRGDKRSVLIDGPYARIRPLRQFESLVFIAGSTGATFTVPLFRDVIQHWSKPTNLSQNRFSAPAGVVTRNIRFVWVVKKRTSINWFASQLADVTADVATLRSAGHDISVNITIYVTCDDALTVGESLTLNRRRETVLSTESSKYIRANSLEKNSSESSTEELCGLDGNECCCTRVAASEDIDKAPCNCGGTSSASPETSTPEKASSPMSADIPVVSGRPHIPNLIRATAEAAYGEMAVVVCGPPGLIQCTRNAAVAISDDRAVHKGTGAQGIYVHAESFGYA